MIPITTVPMTTIAIGIAIGIRIGSRIGSRRRRPMGRQGDATNIIGLQMFCCKQFGTNPTITTGTDM